jgi:tryptophan-rich sensory protein
MKNKIYVFSFFFGLVAIIGFLGSRATNAGLENWYPGLRKPFFQPPSAAFPIAWTALYTVIAVAGSMIYLSDQSRSRSLALAAWTAQMGFNAAWSELFFRHRRPDLALIDSVALLISIGIFCIAARKVDGRAFNLFVPYLAWVVFATLLNEEILRLNPHFL